jgi:hypothetical protein
MTLDEIRSIAEDYFPRAVNFAISNPGAPNRALERLKELADENFERLGFVCSADLFGALTPKANGYLSLMAWSRADVLVSGWQVKVLMRPFYLGAGYVHFQINHNGPMKGFTETGFRSVFTSLQTFSEITPLEYLAEMIPERNIDPQMTLF